MKKTKKLWIIIASLVLIVGLFLGIKAFIEKPSNLGAELHYTGSEQLGCWPQGSFALFCETSPYGYHYFSTKLTVEEIGTYFKNAELFSKQHINSNMTSNSQARTELVFQVTGTAERFTVDYFDSPQQASASANLNYPGNDLNLIRILKANYSTALKAL